MHSDLRVIDPGFTTAYITRDHGYMVYDTLLGDRFQLQGPPQMADWKVSDDKLIYTFTLRDGLKWHDGAPVTAEDCVASLKRWGKVDSMGQKLMDFTASIEATDAKTITLKLKEPYGLVLESIAKMSSYVPFMMPKRLADTPPDQADPRADRLRPVQVRGCGIPARREGGLREEQGLHPAQGAAELDRRRQVAKVDRVEWITMPDAQTAVNALQSGDIDFLEITPWDLVPMLSANNEIKVEVLNKLGYQAIGRMNFLHPPFDNPKFAAPPSWPSTRRISWTRWSATTSISCCAARCSSAARRSRPAPAPTRW